MFVFPVPSRRIKDALPMEVIDKIKSSSRRTRTIAIIEPVHQANGKTNATFNQLSKNVPIFDANKGPVVRRGIKTPRINPGSSMRFQDAANSLNKTKQYRQMGVVQKMTSTTAATVGGQVSLDHDYCSSANKLKRNSRVTAMTAGPGGPFPVRNVYQRSSLGTAGREFTTFPSGGHRTVAPTPGVTIATRGTALPMKKTVSVPIVVSSSSGYSLNASRPYVRVSTGSRVVTANLLKPTPLSSATMLRSESSKPVPGRKVNRVTAGSSGSVTVVQPRGQTEKKDSGMESGDVSDNSDDFYTKVPSYLSTGVPVKSADSYTISGVNDGSTYDRLPAYIRGIEAKKVIIPAKKEAKKVVVVHPTTKSGRERHCSSSSEASTTSVSSRRMTRSVVTKVVEKRPPRHFKSPKRRRSSSSSSNSSYTSSLSDVETGSAKVAAKRRAGRKKVLQGRLSRSPSLSPPPVRRRRYHSPSDESREDEERRVVYVGKIAEGTTRADLRKRFEVFGPILEISVHFRDRG